MRVGAFRFEMDSRPIGGDRNADAKAATLTSRVAALRGILDELNIGIVLLDAEGHVQFINRAFRRFWRVPDEMAES